MPQKMLTPSMLPSHVVNHFGEQYRLAHARPAQAGPLFAAAFQGHQHINDFDARLEDFRFA